VDIGRNKAVFRRSERAVEGRGTGERERGREGERERGREGERESVY
jgi:hypothetical protein